MHTFGSSPLTRGTLDATGRGEAEGRLIPADAGNTMGELAFVLVDTAHPR